MKTKIIKKILSIAVSVSLLTYLITKYNISLFDDSLTLENPALFIFPALFTIVIIPLLAGIRWNIFLKFCEIKFKLKQLIKINFIAIFWGIFLPSSDGFAAIRIYLIEKKYKGQPGITGSTVIAEKLFGSLLLCSVALTSSLFLKTNKEIVFSRIFLLFLWIINLLIILIISNKKIHQHSVRFLSKIRFADKVTDYIIKLHSSYIRMPLKEILKRAIPVMLLIHLICICNVYFLFQIFGSVLPFHIHLALVPVIQLISLIPITLSGFGLRESAFVYFYGLFGIEPNIAMSISVLNFLILSFVPALIGGFINLSEQFKFRSGTKHA